MDIGTNLMKNKELEFKFGQMEWFIKDNLKQIKFPE